MRRTIRHRHVVLWVLAALMLFTSIDLGRSLGSVGWYDAEQSPLSCSSYQLSISQKFRDISTSEITGSKDSASFFHKTNIRRIRSPKHPARLPDVLPALPTGFFSDRNQLLLRPTILTDTNKIIIHYIHDQDGEKDNSFLYL